MFSKVPVGPCRSYYGDPGMGEEPPQFYDKPPVDDGWRNRARVRTDRLGDLQSVKKGRSRSGIHDPKFPARHPDRRRRARNPDRTVDMQLIDDGTYFVAEEGGVAVGCGGWTRRRGFVTTPRRADRCRPDRDSELLAQGQGHEPARVRAMYTARTMHAAASAALSWRPARRRRGRPALPKANCWRRLQASRSTWPPDGGKPNAPSLRRVRALTCPPCGWSSSFCRMHGECRCVQSGAAPCGGSCNYGAPLTG